MAGIIFVIQLSSISAFGKDIYVSADTGKNENPGTKEAPVKLLWKTIKSASEGDTIHVAQGNYPGEGKSGCQPKIETSNIKILGGYTPNFSTRSPFTNHTTVIAPADSTNKCRMHTFHAERADGKLTGVVIDGFIIDRAPLNKYKPDGSQDNSNSPNGAAGIFLVGRGKFEANNNVVMNSAYGGIYIKCGEDSAVRNNIVFSTVLRGIEAIGGSGWGKPTISLENNTSIFSYKFRSSEGRGLVLDKDTAYVVKNNLVAFDDESGLALKFENKNVVFENNQFFMNKYGDIVIGGQGGKRIKVADFGDELSFKTNTGNIDQDPNFKLDKTWLGRWFTRKDAAEGTLTMDDINKYRSARGLPLQGDAGKPAENYAVRYENWQDIVNLAGASTHGAQKK